MLHLLLIDDSPDDRLLAARRLHHEFNDTIQIEVVTDATDLAQALAEGQFDFVITDYRLGWSDGITVLKEIKAAFPDCPIIMLTDSGSEEVAVTAMKAGLDDYLVKSTQQYARLPMVVRNVLQRVQAHVEHKRAELALRESETRLRLALDAAQMGIWDWDCGSGQATWTASNERIFGVPPGSFEGTYDAFLGFVHPDDRERLHHTVQKAVHHQTSYSQEYRIVRPDGVVRWVLGKGEFVCDRAGRRIRMVGISVDITERKQAELALQQMNATLEQQVQERTARLQQARQFDATLKRITDKVRDSLDEDQILQTAVTELALAIGASACNVGIYDLEQRLSTVRYEYSLLDCSLQGQVFSMDQSPAMYHQLLQRNYFQHCLLVSKWQCGHTAVLSCPICDEEGVMGDLWLVYPGNMTFNEQEIGLVQQVANQCAIALRQVQLYQAAQAQVQELEKLNRLKDDFLSTVSHELRTPITNMKLAIQMLQLTTNDDQRQRYLEILRAECDREALLVTDLLDLQRLNTLGTSIVSDSTIDLTQWLPKLLKPFQERTRLYQQHLSIELIDAPSTLQVDGARLERILTELLNNACKYTPANGQIQFQVSLVSDLVPPTVQFRIRNQADIPATELPHIFEKFYRVPNGDPWKRGGTGLGLALVQGLVEQMHGTISATSNDGWTVFTVDLPYPL